MNPLLKQTSQIANVLNAIKIGNVNDIAMSMLSNNPQFRQFYDANKNKPIEQVCSENGLNLDDIKKLLQK